MLTIVDARTPMGEHRASRLAELTAALEHELRLIEELRQALLRQRAGVAADDPEAIEASVHAVGRTLLTLEEARRRRSALVTHLAGDESVQLTDLERHLGQPLPEPLVAARAAVRRAAQAASQEASINQTVLRRALEAGDAYLQQLFASGAAPAPVYTPTAGAPAVEPPAGVLLNRRA